MMSHFCGSDNLVKIIMSLMFILFIFIGTAPLVAGRQNPLVELSSREDLIKMAGYGEEKLSTVMVSGTVLCYACSDQEAQAHPHPVSGALVAVSCDTRGEKRKSNWVRGSTDEYGDFLIDLPSHLHAIPNLEKICLVKVLQVPKNSPCHQAFTGKHKAIRLSSIGDGIRTYTSQTIQLTPKASKVGTNTGGNKAEMV
ncbi:unnamed protein product [Ilex paraguariensis]|uniref:Pollen Ole e 1 allergen and extensin family protein n=1 Tax=Ilex paraguariensis TaxID=185542 RepID=A0ABC8SNP0_9AQUA